MDIYVKYSTLENAAQNLRATSAAYTTGATTLEQVKAQFTGGGWAGQTTDAYIERLDQDIKFCLTYADLLFRFAAVLDANAQALRDKDTELRSSMPG
jgi:uncharacterized protein YukE